LLSASGLKPISDHIGSGDRGTLPARRRLTPNVLPAIAKDWPGNCQSKDKKGTAMASQLAQEPGVRSHPPRGKRLANSHKEKKTAGTILLVEHHRLFLKLIKGILEKANFEVLPASNPKEAKQIEAEFQGTIDLLLSEVMMTPDLLGTRLAKHLKERRPKMRILLMSAYPGGELLILNYGWHFIGHPFMAKALVSRVKEVLSSRIREQGADHFDTRKATSLPHVRSKSALN